MTRTHIKRLHPKDLTLWLAVEAACWRLAEASNCHLREVSPLPLHLVGQFQAWYIHSPDAHIQISLRERYVRVPRGGWWGNRYREHQLFDTICHEMAHCKVGYNRGDVHGSKFFRAFARMIDLAEDMDLRYELRSSKVSLLP